jgi:hypothetical protein
LSRTIKSLFGINIVAQDWETDAQALNRYYTLRASRGDLGAEIQAWRSASFFSPSNDYGTAAGVISLLESSPPAATSAQASGSSSSASSSAGGSAPAPAAPKKFVIVCAVMILAWVLISSSSAR